MSAGCHGMCPVNSSNQSSRVKVWVRIRPTCNFACGMINPLPDGKTINIHCDRDPRMGYINNQVQDWSFRLDGILSNVSQEEVFATTAADVVTAGLDGYNGTILCYGQTGAGKTFTMTGSTESYQNRGIIARAISHLFREIDERCDCAINIRVSYMEIYNETVFDLLSTLPTVARMEPVGRLEVVEDNSGTFVRGLVTHLAQNEEEALNMLFEGETNRVIAAHSLNKRSSRSHCIFTIYIESHSRVESNATYTQSKLNFVDLAGSERLGKTQSEGKTKEEAMYINKSLTFLEQVVLALADKRREHIPFRQSKLTHYLKDSIGGNCSTRLIANVWGEAAQIEETISTLRFATRMMCIPIEPAINMHFNPAIMVKNLEKELLQLKRELAMHDTLVNRSQVAYEPLTEQQRYDIRQQVRFYLEGKSDIEIVNLRQINGVFEAFREITSQIAKEVEDGLRAKYTLLDKKDPAAIAAAQKEGLPVDDKGELVGEVDMKGFNVGPVSSSKAVLSAVVISKKSKSKQALSPQPKEPSPAHGSKTSHLEMPSVPALVPDKDEKRDDLAASVASRTKVSSPPRPSTPPTRTEAFEQFRKDAGSEIYRILTENKELLVSKKKTYTETAKLINCTKQQMDNSLVRLNCLKQQREQEGTCVNEDGDIIISEEEYLEIQRVKDLKHIYRDNYEELRAIKDEVLYCQRVIDQNRQRLIQEFDTWYEESFLGEAAVDEPVSMGSALVAVPQTDSSTKVNVYVEDEEAQFEMQQQQPMLWTCPNPESDAYYSAKMRTRHRRIYDCAASQAPVRKPGTPTRCIRNQPPTTLQVVQ